MNANESAIWRDHIAHPKIPGFTLRTTFPHNPDGVTVKLERWEAGTSEPPHSHPGDDMTVVVEGKILIQFYTRENEQLLPDGPALELTQGQVGYIAAGRVHDAKYVEACKLVYVHDRKFGIVVEGEAA